MGDSRGLFRRSCSKTLRIDFSGTSWRSASSTEWMTLHWMSFLTTTSPLTSPSPENPTYNISPRLLKIWGFTCSPAKSDSGLGVHYGAWWSLDWTYYLSWTFLLNSTLRTIDLHGVALKHTPLQQFYNIIGFKMDYERKHGTITSEALAKLYEDKVRFANPDDAVAWTVWQIFKKSWTGLIERTPSPDLWGSLWVFCEWPLQTPIWELEKRLWRGPFWAPMRHVNGGPVYTLVLGWQLPLIRHLFMPFLSFNEVCKRGVGLHTSFGMTNLLL